MTPTEDLRRFLVSRPKAELHVHLEGTVDSSTLRLLAEKNHIDLSAPTLLRYSDTQQFSIPAPRNLESPFNGTFPEFIQRYVKISSALCGAEDLALLIDSYAANAHSEGVIAAEIYVTPTTLLSLNLAKAELFEGLLAAEDLAQRKHGLSVAWIFDIVRNSPLPGMQTIQLAVEARDRGVNVHAIGLAGLERGHPAPPFAADFKFAAEQGFTLLAHAGETAGAESVRETIVAINPARIGHGVRAIESEELLHQLKCDRTPLEICPWSNVLLGVFDEQSHPVAELVNAGLELVLCADDPGIFGRSLIDNYLFAAERGVSREQLEHLAAVSMKLAARAKRP